MVWAEAANCATDLDCLVVRKNGQRTPFEIFYGKSADYGPHLRTFGEVGVTHNITTVKEKLQDRGHACIFVGYAAQHAGKKSGRLCLSRDIRWIDTSYGEYWGLNNREDAISVESPLGNGEEEGVSTKLTT
jgi:hypothetical protein